MTPAVLAMALVVLVGFRLRFRPPPRTLNAQNVPARHALPRLPTMVVASRRVRTDPAGIAAWCDRLAQAVRSGSTLSAAIRTTDAPPGCREPIGALVLSIGRGASLRESLDIAPIDPDLELAFTVLRACVEHGGPPAEPLDRVAATLRARAAARAERRTHSAQARLSALVMTLLPIAMLGVLVLTSSAIRAVMISPTGAFVFATGSALNLIGWRWMRRLTGGAS